MALAVAGPGGLYMSQLDVSILLDGNVTRATATSYVEDVEGQIIAFSGTGFTYDSLGYPTGGLVTALQVSYQGQLVYQVSGFSTPVTSWVTWANNGDTLGALTTVLGGDDVVQGSLGNDTLAAFSGNDSISGGAGNDLLLGGPSVNGSATGNDSISGGVGDDTLGSTAGVNVLRGDDGHDSIVGGSGFDDINGNMGNDTASGGGGQDWVVGGKDNDSLSGGAEYDVMNGNLGNDTVHGDGGNDVVRGGQDNDVVFGDDGDDFVSGDKGDDTMTGGTGADIFHTFGDNGTDRVTDFHRSEGDVVWVESGTTYTVGQVGGDTVITMSGGGTMTLVGVAILPQRRLDLCPLTVAAKPPAPARGGLAASRKSCKRLVEWGG